MREDQHRSIVAHDLETGEFWGWIEPIPDIPGTAWSDVLRSRYGFGEAVAELEYITSQWVGDETTPILDWQ